MGKTLINAGYVVAYDGERQRLIKDGSVLFEGDRLLFAGRLTDPAQKQRVREESGRVLDAANSLLMPGFVNAHTHAGHLAYGRMMLDHGERGDFSSGFMQYAAPARLAPGAKPSSIEAILTLAECVRFGSTTIVEAGGETGVPMDDLLTAAQTLGTRLYTSPGFREYDWRTNAEGQVQYIPRPNGGFAGLEEAVAWIRHQRSELGEGHEGALLFPLQVDTCGPELLRATMDAAEELDVRVQIHAAQGLFDYRRVMEQYNCTPIEYLHRNGFLNRRAQLVHCVFTDNHDSLPYRRNQDLELIRESGATVIHSPFSVARRGQGMQSLQRLLDMGIPVALGTDTFPRDMINEMRWASILTKLADRDYGSGNAWDILELATLGGAQALGRDDLGRIAPGARADLVLVDLDQLHIGPVYDPVASLVHLASGQDVSHVFVGGELVVEKGRILGSGAGSELDMAALMAGAREEAEAAFGRVSRWDWGRRPAAGLSGTVADREWDTGSVSGALEE